MPARIGTEFAGYRIEALVGRGGTSTVYRAEDPRLRIPIALKLLNPDAAEDESFRERFVREFRLVAGINHPNILPVYDAGVWQDSLYIAMRYVAGGTLKTRVQEGPLAPDRALSMLAHVRHRLRPRQFLRTGRSPAPDGSSGSHRDAKRQWRYRSVRRPR